MGNISNETVNNNSNGGKALIRSHSHSNVNKPSQDLLGLTLHEIMDPIDSPSTSSDVKNAQEEGKSNGANSNVIEAPKEIESDSQLGLADSTAPCNTSKGELFLGNRYSSYAFSTLGDGIFPPSPVAK